MKFDDFSPGELLILNFPYTIEETDDVIVIIIQKSVSHSLINPSETILWKVLTEEGSIIKVPEKWLRRLV